MLRPTTLGPCRFRARLFPLSPPPVSIRSLLLVAALPVVLVACGGGGSSGPRTPPKALVDVDLAALAAAAPDSFVVTFETSAGSFDVTLRRGWAPNGVDRLHFLARNQYFDGGRFFRVLDGFVAQFGLSGIPALDQAWDRRSIPDDPAVIPNKRGTLVFAMAGRNTRATQLFINLVDNPQLDFMEFAPIGEVTRGMDVVDRLYKDYGEGAPYGTGPDQGRILREGNAYLAASFPALDSIVSTTVR